MNTNQQAGVPLQMGASSSSKIQETQHAPCFPPIPGCDEVSEWDSLMAVIFGPGVPMEPRHEADIKANKYLRRELDKLLQKIKYLPPSRHRALSITHLEDSIMRLGMDLKDKAEPNPYPNSRDTSNAVVDKTADGLKL